jgi:hypothetical protein
MEQDKYSTNGRQIDGSGGWEHQLTRQMASKQQREASKIARLQECKIAGPGQHVCKLKKTPHSLGPQGAGGLIAWNEGEGGMRGNGTGKR